MEHYTYRVTWSSEEREYVGLCAEMPLLSHFDKSREGALKGIAKLVRGVVDDMRAKGETPPEALADRDYSGVFKVRVPPSVHRELVLAAAEEGVSLNRIVQARLARP
ncbi:MAG TPA: toxin-antitoxin system HicB family antitoxin [Polyangiaceae bacterium]|jgi:predicted HicB family RNase H-like nuclease